MRAWRLGDTPKQRVAERKATPLFAHAPLPTRSAVVGELDEDLDANLDLSTIMAAPLKTVFH